MAIYTYEDFEKAAKDAGLLPQFSDADLRLAKQNPDAGMSLLKYKTDYINASTAEAKALANAGAEQIRSSYGGYTGGGDGGSFNLDAPSPKSFEYKEAPTYTDRYDGKANELLDKVTSRKEFTYDADSDPLFSQVKKTYTREGRRATKDTLAEVSAATGGIPSSYAVTAAAQAGDYYASKMSDKLQDLYTLAFNKYIQEHNMDLSALGAVRDAQAVDYQKYLNELNQYNTDRSFDYGKLLDEVQNQSAKRSEEFTRAELGASVGDYSHLEKLGIKPDTESAASQALYERELELAKEAAKHGDYSYLNKLLGGDFNPKIDDPETEPEGIDYDAFNRDLKIAQERDKAEGGNKHVTAVYKKFDDGYYGTEKGKVEEPDAAPKSVKDAGGETEAYDYLKKQGQDVLSVQGFRALKNQASQGNKIPDEYGIIARCSTYEEYLDMLFSWLG